MRTMALLRGDIRFQFKYGFYFLYLFLTVLYIILLTVFPDSWRTKAAVLMVFSDPAAMGLFFMGAIVLFEKDEKVLQSIAVSPVLPREYVASKCLSIAFISTAAGIAILLAGGTKPCFYSVGGIFMCSCLITSAGLMLAANTPSLNSFILATIPVEIAVNAPAILYLFGWNHDLLILHPGVCMIALCMGDRPPFLPFFILTVWTILFVWLACRTTDRMLRSLGGAKL